MVYLFHDDEASALPLARRAVQLVPSVDPLKGVLAYAQAKAGHADSARALVAELEAHQGQRTGAIIALAMAHAGLGQTADALSALERAARAQWVSTPRSWPSASDSCRGECFENAPVERKKSG